MAGYGGRLLDPELRDAIADSDAWDLTDIDAAPGCRLRGHKRNKVRVLPRPGRRAHWHQIHVGAGRRRRDHRSHIPFPTPVRDCLAVTEYLRANADALSVDDTRIVVIGISAVGCLAAAVAQAARGVGHAPLAAQMLLWPVLDAAMRTPPMRDRREYPAWQVWATEQMWSVYRGAGASAAPSVLASPAAAA